MTQASLKMSGPPTKPGAVHPETAGQPCPGTALQLASKSLTPRHRPVLRPAGHNHARRAGSLPVAVLDDDPQVIPAEPFDAEDDELVFQSQQHGRTWH